MQYAGWQVPRSAGWVIRLDPRELMVFQSEGWKSWDPERADVLVWVWRQEKKPVSQFKGHQAGRILIVKEGQPFCSVQDFNWLDKAHPH